MSSEPLAPIKQKTTPIPLTGLQQNDCPSHATISYPGNLNSSPALPPEPTLPLQGSPQGTVEFHGVVGGTLCPVYQGVYRKTPVIGKFSSNRYGWLLLTSYVGTTPKRPSLFLNCHLNNSMSTCLQNVSSNWMRPVHIFCWGDLVRREWRAPRAYLEV